MTNDHCGRSGTSMWLHLKSFPAECPFRICLNKGDVWAFGTTYTVQGLDLAHWKVLKANSSTLRLTGCNRLHSRPIVLDELNLPSSWFGVRISNEQQVLVSFPTKKRQSLSKKFIPWWLIKIELQFMLWSTPSISRLLRCIFHGDGWFRWIPGVLHHCWWH